MLTSAGIGNHAVRPQNGRLFPLTANSDHVTKRVHDMALVTTTESIVMNLCRIKTMKLMNFNLFEVNAFNKHLSICT